MEPGYTCTECRKAEHDLIASQEEEELSPQMQRLISEAELRYAFILQERARQKAMLENLAEQFKKDQKESEDELPF
jgi:hypothetical protein